ncbi:MAG: carbohydrate-binding domain-containing protein [Clostridia bacterium]|nr:carbohydrate-binding domain-containing protein [Clostridia bacterium]
MKKIISVLLAFVLILPCTLLFSCSDDEEVHIPAPITLADTSAMDFSFTERDISASYGDSVRSLTFSGDVVTGGASIVNGVLTITEEGTYILSGNADDICITVDAPEKKVQLVLDSFSISNSAGCPIYIRSASKVFITLKDGTESTVSDGSDYEITDGDTNIDSAIFSKADLTVNGNGALKVSGNYKHGIVSKDDLIIVNSKISVSSVGCAIDGKDCVKIKNATLDINAGSDGIRSSNDTEQSRGFVYIEDGKFTITATNDGIQAERILKICNGEFVINAGNSQGYESGKGIKASSDIQILGGVYRIHSYDDSIHSNSTVKISNGDFLLSTDDDGIHANADLSIEGGDICISKSYEGLEAERILISGGKIDLYATDDGLNASGGNDGSGMGGPHGGGDAFASSTAEISISGGYTLINADGDGIDSNGAIYITGGTTLVAGPTNSGNGSLDYGSEAKIYGGILIATGAYGMAQNLSGAVNQGAILTVTGTRAEKTSVALCNEDGVVIASFTPEKAYQCLLISAPGIQDGEVYTVICGGTVAGADENGFAKDSAISGGSRVVEIEMSSLLYGSTGMGGGGMGGAPGGMGGGMPGGGRPR